MKGHVVIIGSGLGGLSSGIILAKNGYKVTILEQESQVGGCLQCFKRDGVKFETGMHFIGSASKGQTLQRLLHYLEAEVPLSPLNPEGYEVIALNGRQYSFANGRQQFIDGLCKFFPDQRPNLNRLCDTIESLANASNLHSLTRTDTDPTISTEYQLRSINDVIDELITDTELRKVVVGNLPLYGAVKDKTPFSTYAFVMDFYNQSAYRIIGGSDRLTAALLCTLRKYDAEVLSCHKVVEVVCNDQRATGVRCEDGTFFEADIVISGIHPARLMEIVHAPLLRPAYRHRIQTIPNTIGGFTVYLHFKPKSVPYMNYNFYSYNTNTPWNCEQYTGDDWPRGYLYMHLCDHEDQQYANSGVILSYMHMRDVEKWKGTKVGQRGADYERFKELHARRLLSCAERDFPGLTSQLQSFYTSTPLTYYDYTGTEDGSMYGIVKDISLGPAARVHHRTKIPNLL
ncbi:MAG: FAD-dependent oxidoreductase, partial [Prevotella sp.]|nr:FAD-dependent oxidoreductase [Prevotella sp.]